MTRRINTHAGQLDLRLGHTIKQIHTHAELEVGTFLSDSIYMTVSQGELITEIVVTWLCVASECATHINTKYVLLLDIHAIYNVNEINIYINVFYKNHRQIM